MRLSYVNRLAFVAVLLGSGVGFAGHGETLLRAPPRHDAIGVAARDAKPELDLCVRQAGPLFGDVIVQFPWRATASKSLGPQGPIVERCVLDALKSHFALRGDREKQDDFVFPVGTPIQMLPPIATFMPVWRAGIAPHATKPQRDAFAALVPADYHIHNNCLVTTRPFAQHLEETWLEGLPAVDSFWRGSVDKLAGHDTSMDVRWDGVGYVSASFGDGLCASAFDPSAARAVFDREGSCWVGSAADILVAPQVELPPASYTQVATQAGRTCGLTASGTVTCCGPSGLAAAPKHAFTQLALGSDFACGLDGGGHASCWGRVKTAPNTEFTELVAGGWRVCGIHRDHTVECWSAKDNRVLSPKGTFSTIALADSACGIHTDGSAECWEREPQLDVSIGWKTLALGPWFCGTRADHSVGCWDRGRNGKNMIATIGTDHWTHVAVAELGACGIALDGTIECRDLEHHRSAPAPKGVFTQIASDGAQFCALGASGIACWGNTWPHRQPLHKPAVALHGSVVDETGAPIANATVKIDSGHNKTHTVQTASDGTWASPEPRDARIEFSAPGREIVSFYGEPAMFAAPVTLLRAATISIDAVCDGKPCHDVTTELGRLSVERGKPLENMAPGSYRLLVWNWRGSDHEQLAIVDVDMPFDAKPQTVRVELNNTGTGNAIRGTVTTTSTDQPLGTQFIELKCAHGLDRKAFLNQRGDFEIVDAPPLPCTLEAGGGVFDTVRIPIATYSDRLTIPIYEMYKTPKR